MVPVDFQGRGPSVVGFWSACGLGALFLRPPRYRRCVRQLADAIGWTSTGVPFALAKPPAALALDGKKLAAFSARGGGFLRFPIGDRRCNRTRASVGNAGGAPRPSLRNTAPQ